MDTKLEKKSRLEKDSTVSYSESEGLQRRLADTAKEGKRVRIVG